MGKKITKTWFEKLFVFFISIFLFSSVILPGLGFSPAVSAESGAASNVCKGHFSDPVNAPTLEHISKQQWLNACYYGYDTVGPDLDGAVAESGFEGCYTKYAPNHRVTPNNSELIGACNVGASEYRTAHPEDPRYGDVHFHATDSDGKPVQGAFITIANNSDCHSGATTGNDGNASIECRKGQNHQVKIESTNPKYKPVSGDNITVKVRQAPYQIKFTEDAQHKKNLQDARQACKDRDQQAADNNWAPIVSIDDCVTGYLAQLDGKTKDEACSIFGEGLGKQDCEIGYDLASAAGGGEAAGDAPTECQGEGLSIGWVICGIVEAVSTFSQWVFNDFIQPLMENTPLSLDTADPFYKSWQGFRFIGNILLIGSFMAIVYSQARGGGGGQ